VNAFLLSAAGLIILAVAFGLARILRGPGDVDALMATQLLGSGGIGALLLVASSTDVPGVNDVALGLALLAAFAAVSFINALEVDDREAGS
jgi:multicomponent Na+:H+ antiporter subunit F